MSSRTSLGGYALSALVLMVGCRADAPPGGDASTPGKPWGPSACYHATAPRKLPPPKDGGCFLRDPPIIGLGFAPYEGTATVVPTTFPRLLAFRLDKVTSRGNKGVAQSVDCVGKAALVDMIGLRVRLRLGLSWSKGAGVDASATYAFSVRNLEGELLWANYDDGFTPEGLADVIPEVSIATGRYLETREFGCKFDSNVHDRYENFGIDLSTKVNALRGVLPGKAPRYFGISIGCVDYLVGNSYCGRRVTNNCFRSRSIRPYAIIRRSLIRSLP